jgi:hypothetical protein
MANAWECGRLVGRTAVRHYWENRSLGADPRRPPSPQHPRRRRSVLGDRSEADARRARVRRAAVFWNPVDEGRPISREGTERRLAAFAATGLDEERMRAWSVTRGAYLGVDDPDVEVLRELL